MQLTENTYLGEGNRYYLEKLLGRGGFSEVWLVKDALTDKEEALKVYAPSTGMDDDGLRIFTKELDVVRNIHHPNLLTSSYIGVWQNMPYLVMPYCPQGSLVKKIGKIKEDEAWQILKDVAAGLDYLHGQPSPIIHQDIKPDNILVDTLGHYVITDFGISARAQSTLRKSVHSAAIGTRAYMAPERFGDDPLPKSSGDIWALGATLFELIEGYAPFGELGGLSQKDGADIPQIKADVSDKLKQSVYGMLSLDPLNRPASVKISNEEKDDEKLYVSLYDVNIPLDPFKRDIRVLRLIDYHFIGSSVPKEGGIITICHPDYDEVCFDESFVSDWVHLENGGGKASVLRIDENTTGKYRSISTIVHLKRDEFDKIAYFEINQKSLSKFQYWSDKLGDILSKAVVFPFVIYLCGSLIFLGPQDMGMMLWWVFYVVYLVALLVFYLLKWKGL